MTQLSDSRIVHGFDGRHRAAVAALYWQAFGAKLDRVMRPADRAQGFFAEIVDPSHAFSVQSPDGQVLGLAGFKTAQGAFAGGELSDLQRHYGWWGSLWRGIILSVLERPVQPGVLLMDGIAVDARARGQGLGSRLLTAVKEHARADGYTQVRLDVIDSNPRARALYERHGFVAGETADIGPLSRVFGFRRATTMICTL